MVISQINSVNFTNVNLYKNNKNMTMDNSVHIPNMKMKGALKTDTVSFTSLHNLTPNQKMKTYALQLLKDNAFKENRKIHIIAESKYLPFMNVLSETAYKKGSGNISMKVIEPELEALKKKHNIKETFDFEKENLEELKQQNAIILRFNDKNNPYKLSNLTKTEEAKEFEKTKTIVPKEVYDEFKISPKEVFKDALDVREGQPVSIYAEREHLPIVEKLVDYLYGENKTKLVTVNMTRDSQINKLKFAKDSVLEEAPTATKRMKEEFYNKDVAYLVLDGEDPRMMEDIDSDRIVKNSRATRKSLEEIQNKIVNEIPWLVYYAPTTKSCVDAYPELKNEPVKALSKAFKDANKINRMGHLHEHVENLSHRANKMNELLDNGYRTLHYVSVDAKTGKPDGKTDFKVTMSPNSQFMAAKTHFAKYNHNTMCNIPTEEVFTSPQADTAEGVISATMPLSLNGKIVEGIRFKFEKGKMVDIKADKNEEMLKKHISANDNADRLGEVALVAGSPIAETGRLFNSTLLDENASCHLAFGNSYSMCIKGADEFKEYKDMKNFLKDLKINSSPTHNDFMVGGKNVNISAINEKTGDTIDVIKDDKFLL